MSREQVITERWVAVGNGYEVSDRGRVRSPRGELSICLNGSGYPHVAIWVDGVSTTWRVHSLMMHAFVGPRPPGMLTRHLDDDKTNNVLSNLAYGTLSDNGFDAVRNGRHHQAGKKACDNGHEFTSENTYREKRGRTRHCRTCRREASARSRGRK